MIKDDDSHDAGSNVRDSAPSAWYSTVAMMLAVMCEVQLHRLDMQRNYLARRK